jgi:hypothetical protein
MLGLMLTLSSCKVNRSEGPKMLRNDQTLISHCVGRQFIGLPASFSPSSVTTGVFKETGTGPEDPFLDVVVRDGGIDGQEFKSQVEQRRADIKRKNHGAVNVLREDVDLASNVHLFRVQEIEDAYVSELTVRRGTSLITIRLDSFRNQFIAAEKRLVNFVKRDKVEKNTVTTGSFCLGPIAISGAYTDEKGGFLFRDGKGNSYKMEIDTFAHDGETSLLQRMLGPASLLSIFDVSHRVLRKGERNVAGMHAEEWLGSAKLSEHEDRRALQFTVETMRQQPSKIMPSLTVTFSSANQLEDGTPTKTSMSDSEAIELWDNVVGTIRPAEI